MLIGLASCDRTAADDARNDANPLVVAETYARAHFPANEVPNGLARRWIVEDNGDVWTVEFGTQNTLGGGISMTIRKRDMTVVHAERTQ